MLFSSGVIAMGYIISGLFFLRFWTHTGDKLFPAFAAAFWLLALNQALSALLEVEQESQNLIFLVRLTAFVIIIGAIVAKNMNMGQAVRPTQSATKKSK